MIKDNNVITLTIVANMTANYGETLGNCSTIQKVVLDGKQYGKRSKESLKYAIMKQTGFYDDVHVDVNKAACKISDDNVNISNCRSLEGGYMSTKGEMFKRNSSFYISDAISVEPFNCESDLHNNLGLATQYAKQNNLSVGKDASACGLMIYNYEYSHNMMIYSITIDLNRIGVDENLGINVDNAEKIDRVIKLLEAVQNLSLIVKGSLDNAAPMFVIGGFSKYKTHIFDHYVRVKDKKLLITDSLIKKLEKNEDCKVGMIDETFENDKEIKEKLNVMNIDDFFDQLIEEVKVYYKE